MSKVWIVVLVVGMVVGASPVPAHQGTSCDEMKRWERHSVYRIGEVTEMIQAADRYLEPDFEWVTLETMRYVITLHLTDQRAEVVPVGLGLTSQLIEVFMEQALAYVTAIEQGKTMEAGMTRTSLAVDMTDGAFATSVGGCELFG